MKMSVFAHSLLLLFLASLVISLPIDGDVYIRSNVDVTNEEHSNVLPRNVRATRSRSTSNHSTRSSATALSHGSVHSQCMTDGLPFANSLGSFQCKSFTDLIGVGASVANNGLNSLASSNIKDPQIASIHKDIVSPIISGLVDRIDSLSSLPVSVPMTSILDSNMCLGNFDDYDVFDDYEGVCGSLPIDDEWTVMGFSLDVGIGSPFHAMCPTITDPLGTFASVCIAISTDSCSNLPSVALAMSTSILSCTPFDKVLGASTAGASVAVIKAVDVAFDSFTFGVSLSNAFRKEFKTFDGKKIVPTFVAPGSFYMSGELALSPKAISLPDVFELSGEASQMFGINADVTKVKGIVDGLSKSGKRGAAATFDLVKSVDFSVLNSMVLNLKFCFSNLKKGKKGDDGGKAVSFAIPDSDPFEVGTASLFATSYTVVSGNEELKPGMYVYGSASPGNIVKALVKYMLKFTGEILRFLPDWLPPGLKLDPSDLAEKIKISGSGNADLAFGIAATLPDRVTIFLKVPLIISQLGYLQLKCQIDISDEKFKCSVKTAFNEQIFGAIADALEDGALWVAKQLTDFGDDVLDKGKQVLAVGMSTLGDAAEDVGSVFSKATVAATAGAIEGGRIALDKLDDAAGEVASWAAKATGELDDFMDDVGDAVVDAVEDVGRVGKQVINGAKDVLDDATDELEKAARVFASSMQCSVNAVVSTLSGKSNKCRRSGNVAKALKSVGRNVDKAFKNIEKSFAGVSKKIGDAITDAFKDVIGIGKQRRKKVSVDSKKLKSPTHAQTGCQLTEYVKVTRYEKRTCVVVCGKWKHDKTVRETLGKIPKDSCVRRVVQQVRSAMDRADKVTPLETKYNELKKSDVACSVAKGMNKSTLVRKGLACSTELKHNKGVKVGKVFLVPTTVKCSIPEISTSGNMNKKVTVSQTSNITVTARGVNKSQLAALKKKAIKTVISKITTNCKAK